MHPGPSLAISWQLLSVYLTAFCQPPAIQIWVIWQSSFDFFLLDSSVQLSTNLYCKAPVTFISSCLIKTSWYSFSTFEKDESISCCSQIESFAVQTVLMLSNCHISYTDLFTFIQIDYQVLKVFLSYIKDWVSTLLASI